MIRILLDADACPVKDETYRVAARFGCPVLVVANSRLSVPRSPRVTLQVVSGRFDAADDFIAEQATSEDVVVTADIPLAARVLAKGARALDGRGRVFTPDSIGDALAAREFSAFLRDMGELAGGPPPFSARDRSAFLQALDTVLQSLLKAQRQAPRTPPETP